MGLNAGPVPPRVDGPVKQALLGLAADAVSAGFSLRQAATWLGVNHTRLLQWRTRDQAGRGLHDEPAGSAEGLVDLRVYAASVAVGFMMSSNSTGVSFPSRR